MANNAGVAQSQNCSVNQSISIGGGAASHASNHGGADRSPIRMRNVEDYSQVMQRLKQQLPSNSTPKLSRNKAQKHPTADRSHFATGQERQRATSRRHSQGAGNKTHRPAREQLPGLLSQSSDNLGNRQQAQAWMASRSQQLVQM